MEDVLKRLLKSLLQFEICKAKLVEVPEDSVWTSLAWMTKSFCERNWKDWYESAKYIPIKEIKACLVRVLPIAKQEAIMPYVQQINTDWLTAVVDKSAEALDPESFLPPIGTA